MKLIGLGEPHWLARSDGETGESSADDLVALGRAALTWAAIPTSGKSKAKPLPEELQAILNRLQTDEEGACYPSAQGLIEDLDRADSKVPPSSAAWDRLLRQVREQADRGAMRESA